MSANELLDNLSRLAEDFMELAMETEGVRSGLAAECSQRLKDTYDEFQRRFELN